MSLNHSLGCRCSFCKEHSSWFNSYSISRMASESGIGKEAIAWRAKKLKLKPIKREPNAYGPYGVLIFSKESFDKVVAYKKQRTGRKVRA